MPSLIRSLPKKAVLATTFSTVAYENFGLGLIKSAQEWFKYEIEALVRAVEPYLPNSVHQTLVRLVRVCKPDNRDPLTWYYHGFSDRLWAAFLTARRSTTYTNLSILEEMQILTRRGGQKRENGRFACDKSAVNYRLNIAALATLAYACQMDQAEVFDIQFKSPIPERHRATIKTTAETVRELASKAAWAALKAKQGIEKAVDKLLKGGGKAEEITSDLNRSPKSGLKCSAGNADKGQNQKLNNNNRDYSDFSAFEKLDPSDFSALNDPG